ncbi:MAG: tRNA glutamyl-Q(34) synthetase GluQRS [Magnetococcales bacterium]|nr:tRNA glutamyl-Q(34) synthetase GluQRS [Magnetococcales bacterium]
MIITRFAPSPSGYLHLGHAYSALLAYHTSQQQGGRFILRIEDIDIGRCRTEFDHAIREDLAWLGIHWQEPVRRQSEHLDDYAAGLERLTAMGLLYPCFCTRKEIIREAARANQAPHGPEGVLYPGTCRTRTDAERKQRIDASEPHALRLNMKQAVDLVAESLTWTDAEQGTIIADPLSFGDVILARKEAPTSYHLSVSLDDHLQGITHVIRGVDLFGSTHVHRLLQALLNLSTPTYHHHKLLNDEEGKRYAKRHKALTLRALRESGVTAEEIVQRVGLVDLMND